MLLSAYFHYLYINIYTYLYIFFYNTLKSCIWKSLVQAEEHKFDKLTVFN